jgi:hypothetical protein
MIEFEEEMAQAEMPSTAGIINSFGKPKITPVSADALWLWGRLRDFERDGLLAKSPQSVLETAMRLTLVVIPIQPVVINFEQTLPWNTGKRSFPV